MDTRNAPNHIVIHSPTAKINISPVKHICHREGQCLPRRRRQDAVLNSTTMRARGAIYERKKKLFIA